MDGQAARRWPRLVAAIVAFSVMTMAMPSAAVAVDAGTREVAVAAEIAVMAGDADGAALDAVVVADTGGALVTVPSALAVGLTRGLPVTVTLTAPVALDDAQALAAVGAGDPTVAVTAVTPTGPPPVLAFSDQDGTRTASVLVPSAGATGVTTVPYGLTSAIAAWQVLSGGSMTIAAAARLVPFDITGTCDPAVLANRAITADGAAAPSGRDLVVVQLSLDCPWRSFATLGGSYVLLNGLPATEPVAHALGHALGLADVDWDDLMTGGGDGGGQGSPILNAAMASALGWVDVADVPTAAPWTVSLRRPIVGRPAPPQALVLPDVERGEVFVDVGTETSGSAASVSGSVTTSFLRILDLSIEDGVAGSTVVAKITPGTPVGINDGTMISYGGWVLGGTSLVGVVPAGVDDQAPTSPVVVVPADGWVTVAHPTLTWSAATDDGVGLAGYAVMIDGEKHGGATGNSTSASLVHVPRGAHEVIVVATDRAGNATPSEPVSLMFGDWDDLLAVDTPVSLATVSNPVTISWHPGPALTTPIAAYRVSMVDRPVRIVPSTTTSITLPLFAGLQVIYVTAVGADGANLLTRAVTVTGDAPPGSLFVDVTGENHFVREIFWLAGAAITTGFVDGSFRPTTPVSRSAMAAFLYRYPTLSHFEAPAPTTGPFVDVPVGHQFDSEIAWLKDAGITTGYADGRFHGELPVTREAMAAFLYRFAEVADSDSPLPAESPFTDVPVDHPFYREIVWLARHAITTGYPDGTFRPGDPVTREAMAAFLYRMSMEPA